MSCDFVSGDIQRTRSMTLISSSSCFPAPRLFLMSSVIYSAHVAPTELRGMEIR